VLRLLSYLDCGSWYEGTIRTLEAQRFHTISTRVSQNAREPLRA
jgi:hypothetical protein